ncbi:P-loop containing nucleoside triphosphate hydrolase [Trinorchestia longiramus]|nr:P-loop containing nucleoside triphosphate hydrolase [Trinorchestia longiramus]
MVGPPQSGKTTLSNFLSEAGEVGSTYRPTKGCRIVEFEVPNVQVGASNSVSSAEVELWDVSGDMRHSCVTDVIYEHTWPVMQRSANGVIFVCNPGSAEDQKQQLQFLYTQFVQQNGIKDTQCVVFNHQKPNSEPSGAALGGPFSHIPQLDTELGEKSGQVQTDFKSFLSSVLGHLAEATTRTENLILQQLIRLERITASDASLFDVLGKILAPPHRPLPRQSCGGRCIFHSCSADTRAEACVL